MSKNALSSSFVIQNGSVEGFWGAVTHGTILLQMTEENIKYPFRQHPWFSQ